VQKEKLEKLVQWSVIFCMFGIGLNFLGDAVVKFIALLDHLQG
jgi:hypothetical protein